MYRILNFQFWRGKLDCTIRTLCKSARGVTFNTGTGANIAVQSIVLQPDGRILIGGDFTAFNQIPTGYFARLTPEGTLDDTFGTGANFNVMSIALQSDGKVLIGGWFTSFNGIPANRIVRLNPDGTLDDTFNTGSGANNWINAIALQPDGKVLTGGIFTSFNEILANRIARLNQDGTIDNSFSWGAGVSSIVKTIALQPDGKILIGGTLGTFNGNTSNRIARLHGDVVVTHVSELSNRNPLMAYPNPFGDIVEILTADVFMGNDYRWEVMDATGRILIPRESSRSRERLILNFEDMTNGVYIIRLTDGERSYTARVVKE